MRDPIERQAAINETLSFLVEYCGAAFDEDMQENLSQRLMLIPSAQPEQRWIPVTLETLPNPNSVVVVCGKNGTWDYGTYRGWYGDIYSWQWKKNTIKHVYWWMYKADALPEPYREGDLDE